MSSREEYFPYGETSAGGAVRASARFDGKRRDAESGTYDYGLRTYAAWTCRFTSVDPLAGDYPELSAYGYAGGRPVTMVDLDGAEPASPSNAGSVSMIEMLPPERVGLLFNSNGEQVGSLTGHHSRNYVLGPKAVDHVERRGGQVSFNDLVASGAVFAELLPQQIYETLFELHREVPSPDQELASFIVRVTESVPDIEGISSLSIDYYFVVQSTLGEEQVVPTRSNVIASVFLEGSDWADLYRTLGRQKAELGGVQTSLDVQVLSFNHNHPAKDTVGTVSAGLGREFTGDFLALDSAQKELRRSGYIGALSTNGAVVLPWAPRPALVYFDTGSSSDTLKVELRQLRAMNKLISHNG